MTWTGAPKEKAKINIWGMCVGMTCLFLFFFFVNLVSSFLDPKSPKSSSRVVGGTSGNYSF